MMPSAATYICEPYKPFGIVHINRGLQHMQPATGFFGTNGGDACQITSWTNHHQARTPGRVTYTRRDGTTGWFTSVFAGKFGGVAEDPDVLTIIGKEGSFRARPMPRCADYATADDAFNYSMTKRLGFWSHLVPFGKLGVVVGGMMTLIHDPMSDTICKFNGFAAGGNLGVGILGLETVYSFSDRDKYTTAFAKNNDSIPFTYVDLPRYHALADFDKTQYIMATGGIKIFIGKVKTIYSFETFRGPIEVTLEGWSDVECDISLFQRIICGCDIMEKGCYGWEPYVIREARRDSATPEVRLMAAELKAKAKAK